MRKLLQVVLIALCAVLVFGCTFNCVVAAVDCFSLGLSGMLSSSPEAARYVAIVLIGLPLDIVNLFCFIAFTYSIVRKRTFFSKAQTIRLGVIGLSLLVETGLQLLLPEFVPPVSALVSEQPATVMPTLDLRMLSFSLMFFALAGIFEYGRQLQEDSDSII